MVKQPIKKQIKPSRTPKPKKKSTSATKDVRLRKTSVVKKKRKHPEYGTSKLEERFAREFLDKIGVEYKYQYKAEAIGRYFDFRILPYGPMIEIQGSYWHGDKRLYEDKDLNWAQRRSRYVDELKAKWCAKNGIKLICIWEKDINSDPAGVLNYLKEELKKYIKNDRKTYNPGN